MKNKFLILMTSLIIAMFGSSSARSESITLGWAAWDPANALVELSKGFTAETGIEVNFEFVPWPNFADRMLNELNNQGKTFDLLIGDSQWIGGGAVYGHYVKLNDFFDQEGISMDDFSDATDVTVSFVATKGTTTDKVRFYINRTLVGTHTTNVPTVNMTQAAMEISGNATGTKSMSIDYIMVAQDRGVSY